MRRLPFTCYELIEDVFKDLGTCYRLGGDEFACILTDEDKKNYEKAIETLEYHLAQRNKWSENRLKVAIGTGIYRICDVERFKEFMHRVDVKMYKDKRLKRKSKVEMITCKLICMDFKSAYVC